jgi:ATP-binding cassette, subfamily B, bacterial
MSMSPRMMSPGTGRVRQGAPDIGKGAKLPPGLVRRVWVQFARPYRLRLLGFLLAIIATAGLAVLPPVLFGLLIDRAVLGGDLGMVNLLALAAVGVALATALMSLLQRWQSSWIGERLIYDLRRMLFDHVQRMPVAFFTRTQTGALISRLNNDVVGAQQAVTGTFGSVVANAVQLTAALVVMVSIEWRLTLLVLGVLPLFIVPARRVGAKLQGITREGMQLNASMNSRMTERFNVAGAMLVKLFGRFDEEAQDFAAKAKRVADIGVRTALVGRIFFVTLALVGAVGVAVVYWVGGRLAITDPGFSPGNIVTFAGLVTTAYSPLAALTNARVEVMSAFVSFERVFEILDLEHPIAERPGAVTLVPPRTHPASVGSAGGSGPGGRSGSASSGSHGAGRRTAPLLGGLEFDDVHFAYPAPDEATLASLEERDAVVRSERSDPVLRGVSFRAAPGQTVALVGPSGAGKTTMLNLVPRLYDVTAGAVRVDGWDVRDVTLASLGAAVGVVTQDAHLFHDTVRENLRYARPHATDLELEEACRAAQIHSTIAGLPDGYDTMVGERGYRMSGGEKQRLAIARMLLKDPAIVLLDEATSHLDSESEALVQQALAAGLEGRTSLVIAHRLSTIVEADLILVVRDGRIVQRGTHHELLEAEGLYAELSRTQFRLPTP